MAGPMEVLHVVCDFCFIMVVVVMCSFLCWEYLIAVLSSSEICLLLRFLFVSNVPSSFHLLYFIFLPYIGYMSAMYLYVFFEYVVINTVDTVGWFELLM